MSSRAAATSAAEHDAHGVELFESGRAEEAITSFREAVRLEPGRAPAHYNLGNALTAVGRLGAACDAFRDAIAASPGFALAHRNLGLVLLDVDDVDAAVPVLERAVQLEPGSAGSLSSLAVALVRQGSLQRALELLDRSLAKDPRRTRDLALRAVVLDRLGEHDAALELLDFDRLVTCSRPAAPAGFVDMAAFNAALADFVLAHPSLEDSPPQHATRGGRHSGELLLDPNPVVEGLENIITAEVERYVARVTSAGVHPFVADAPDTVALTAWAIVLERGGHQIPHIHSASWLSGVYYVQVPELDAGPRHEGWLEFGSPDSRLSGGHELPIHRVCPVPGEMVLFPAYIYHHTVPFRAPGTRISIAFDCQRASPD